MRQLNLRLAQLAMLVMAFTVLLGGLAVPQQAALAAGSKDKNASVTIQSVPDEEGVDVIVYITNELNRPLNYDIRIAIPEGIELEKSWAGDPNSNPGKNTGIDVGWVASLAVKGRQGPFVARFAGNTPFTTRASVLYTGTTTGKLLTEDLTTGGIGGLDLPPALGDGTLSIAVMTWYPLSSLTGIIDAEAPAGDDSGAVTGPGYGLPVLFVDPDSPTGKAGVRSGDMLLSLNGEPIYDNDTYFKTLYPLKANQQVTLVVRRGSKQITIKTRSEKKSEALSQRHLDELNAALENDPENPALLMAKAFWWDRDQDNEQAIADLNAAIAVAPKASALLDLRGFFYDYIGEPEKALLDYKAALKLDPNNYSAMERLAYLALADDDIDLFTQYIEACLKANPTDAFANYYEGVIEAEINGDLDKALERYQLSYRSNPYYEYTSRKLGIVYAALGNTKKARYYFRIAIYMGTDEQARQDMLERYNRLES